MKNEIKILYEKARSTMLDFESSNTMINNISNKNITIIRLKELMKNLSNTVISDLLTFSDLLYQLLDAEDNDLQQILDDFTGEVNDGL